MTRILLRCKWIKQFSNINIAMTTLSPYFRVKCCKENIFSEKTKNIKLGSEKVLMMTKMIKLKKTLLLMLNRIVLKIIIEIIFKISTSKVKIAITVISFRKT